MSDDPAAESERVSETDAQLAARLAVEAGHLLVQVRDELTRAGAPAWHVMDAGDIASHRFIAAALAAARPDDAVLSEEGFEDPRRFDADRVWIVDPLDGTSEFGEHGRHDWAVHVALWDGDHFGAGAVSIPALGMVFCTDPAPIVPPFDRERPRLVTSRNRNPYVAVVIANALDADAVRLGSAGAKAMAVVTGEADIYVHDGGMYQWDSAAPAAVALAAGLHVSRIDGSPMVFNDRDPWLPDLLICRTEFAAPALRALARRSYNSPMTLAVPGDGGLLEPTFTADAATHTATEARVTTHVPGLAIAAMSSIGAGIIHAAAAGVHAEHTQLARLFILCAIAQMGVGLLAVARPIRWLALPILAVNALAVGVWLATRITGISSIEGLEVREAPQFADTASALLAAAAVGCALAAAMVGKRQSPAPRLMFPALAIAALTIPAMLSSGTHVHSHAATSAGGVVDESQPHSHTADGTSIAAAPAGADPNADPAAVPVVDESQPHSHTADSTADGTSVALANWPRPWDPSQPIDVSGVAGVTPDQEARATKLIEESLKDLPKFADTAAAVAAGYASIGDAGTGSEHYINLGLIEDDDFLDPEKPESLVYTVNGDQRTLAGAMYIASARPTDDPSLLAFAGPLMQWHNHGNLCWAPGPDGKPRVVGITDANGNCANGVNTGGGNPMVHVWVTPHPCGVFAALEGVGAGQAAVPDAQRVDMCNAAHSHTAAVVPPKPYDPTQPIDLGGVDGVTPEQQAAAENLVALNVVRLPQWSDYRTAEAAGYHSIGDGLTGYEHFIKWDLINDDVSLDPDHPESLVYQPQPDGSKKLVSAMYFLPDTVALTDVPDIGGALMQWHIHDNLCFTDDAVAPRVAGVTSSTGTSAAPLVKFRPAPMIHVWITPNKCGPFAALEGVGAGQIADGETRLCDSAHGAGF